MKKRDKERSIWILFFILLIVSIFILSSLPIKNGTGMATKENRRGILLGIWDWIIEHVFSPIDKLLFGYKKPEKGREINEHRIEPKETTQPICGNKIIEAGEECDFIGCEENFKCNDKCKCEPIVMQPICGNGLIEQGEECDIVGCGENYECNENCRCVEIIVNEITSQQIKNPIEILLSTKPKIKILKTGKNSNVPFDFGDYPIPFVSSTGEPDVAIIIGEYSSALDTISAGDVQSSLVVKLDGAFSKTPNEVFFDYDIDSVKNRNLILIGGSWVNKITAEVLGLPYPTDKTDGAWQSKTNIKNSGQAIIKFLNSPYKNGKVIMIVAGYDNADTMVTAKAISEGKIKSKLF